MFCLLRCRCFSEGFRPCGAAYFFLLRQEKVSKKKATLGRCRLRRFPALLGTFQGARENNPGFEVYRQSSTAVSSWAGFGVPLRGAEQRRRAGGLRLALSEPQASLASRPERRVAQGTGRSPALTWGSPFLWLLSFGEAKESTPAGQRRNPAHQKTRPARQAQNPAAPKSPLAARQQRPPFDCQPQRGFLRSYRWVSPLTGE